MKCKKLTVLLFGMLMVVCFCRVVSAQNLETNVVAGNRYAVFFFTPLDAFSSDITFGEDGTLTLSSFGGRGIYFSLIDFFAGYYFALNANIGEESGDILMLMTGTVLDPFIFGTGVVLIDYTKVTGFIFSGRVIEQEE